MEYKFIKEYRENIEGEGEWVSLLVSADGVELWIDCHKADDDYWEWDFNQYIFDLYNSKDIEAKETQKKIYEDVENFDCFITEILENINKGE